MPIPHHVNGQVYQTFDDPKRSFTSTFLARPVPNEAAVHNLDGLVAALEDDGISTLAFCDFHNRFHDGSLDVVKSLRRDVARHTQALYRKNGRFGNSLAGQTQWNRSTQLIDRKDF